MAEARPRARAGNEPSNDRGLPLFGWASGAGTRPDLTGHTVGCKMVAGRSSTQGDELRTKPVSRTAAWAALWLLLLGLAACGAEKADPQATIDALHTTLAAQEHALATAEAEISGWVPVTCQCPTCTPPAEPTVLLSTPRPVSTVQRPPTATPTSTPRPTPTSTASPTPVPDAAVGQWKTNLRSGPSVGYSILAEVEAGSPLEVLGKSADGEWLQVRTPAGLEGWMFLFPLELYLPLDSVPVTG